jgi:hypothetical protein
MNIQIDGTNTIKQRCRANILCNFAGNRDVLHLMFYISNKIHYICTEF